MREIEVLLKMIRKEKKNYLYGEYYNKDGSFNYNFVDWKNIIKTLKEDYNKLKDSIK